MTEQTNQLQTNQLQTILCIGDSLTEGDYGSEPEGTANVKLQSYPYFLQKYLGANTNVINAGKCGFTAVAYWERTLKTLAVENADVIIIMLGTNGEMNDSIEADTRSSHYETYADTEAGRYCSIIEYVMEKNPKAAICLCTCPYVDVTRRPRNAKNVAMANQVLPKIAARYHLPLFDVNGEMGVNDFNTKIMQPIDGLHGGILFYNRLANYIGSKILSVSRFAGQQMEDL